MIDINSLTDAAKNNLLTRLLQDTTIQQSCGVVCSNSTQITQAQVPPEEHLFFY